MDVGSAATKPGTRIENWDTEETSERGIEGIKRMRLVRDDILQRIEQLAIDLSTRGP